MYCWGSSMRCPIIQAVRIRRQWIKYIRFALFWECGNCRFPQAEAKLAKPDFRQPKDMFTGLLLALPGTASFGLPFLLRLPVTKEPASA
jgi:hypothetical protein